MRDSQILRCKKKLRNAIRIHKRTQSARFDTSDIVQEGLIQLWSKSQKNSEDQEANTAFLNCVGKGLVRNKIRFHSALKRSVSRETNLSEHQIVAPGLDPGKAAEKQERLFCLLDAIPKLPAKQRLALKKRIFEKATLSEIAKDMDCSVDVVRTLLKNAKRQLRTIAGATR